MDMQTSKRRSLYPPIEPYQTGMLDVGDGHSLYWELSGNPEGKPVVFLHGGPGGGSSPDHRRQFNPDKYKILVFDQRGCGKSTPFASLDNNTTWDLVDDIEKLRTQVSKVDKWQVFGGSWGSTLSLAYAQKYPERVTELVLRGIFLGSQSEYDWLYKYGASELYPEQFEAFLSVLPPEARDDSIRAFRDVLTGDDEAAKIAAAKAWSAWEIVTCTLLPQPEIVEEFTDDHHALATARIENHYFLHNCWLEEGQLLEGAKALRGIPGIIVQGRHDCCTPPGAAWALKKAWPEVDLQIVPDGGHLYSEPGITDGLVRATDQFADR